MQYHEALLTILHKNPPACDIAAGPSCECVWGGRDTHRLHQVIEENRRAELQEGDVVIRCELVILGVEEDPTDQSGCCSMVPPGHHAHPHVSPPRTSVWVSADMISMNAAHTWKQDENLSLLLTWWHLSPGSSELQKWASGWTPVWLHRRGRSDPSGGWPARATTPPPHQNLPLS